MKGLSITIVFGSYGGFYSKFDSFSWRICVGWVAFTIYPQTDIEDFMVYLKNRTK